MSMNAFKTRLFGQTTKQLLSNLEPWKSWKYKQFLGLWADPNCLYKGAHFVNWCEDQLKTLNKQKQEKAWYWMQQV